MKVSEVKAMLKELKETDDIMISVPFKGSNYMYTQFSLIKDLNWKCYKLQINENT